VCKKEGCWSTKHTVEEREASKQKYRAQYRAQFGRSFDQRVNQYILEVKGVNTDKGNFSDSDLNDFESFAIDFKGNNKHTEQFIVFIVNSLRDYSFDHTLTQAISPTQADLFAYSTTTSISRYNASRFYDVMIDTRALRVLTTGFGQYLAYQGTIDSNATLDKSTAGAVSVQFGISSTALVSSLTLQTLVRTVQFHVIKADTLFLLCLADLDSLILYFNNITNKVVTLTGTVPVIR
jgi:hypothetical protein